jgi:hypothetical protein
VIADHGQRRAERLTDHPPTRGPGGGDSSGN